MKALHSLFLILLATVIVVTACEKNPLESSDLFADSFDALDKATDPEAPEGSGGQGGTPLPIFILDGPGPFFFWALDLSEDQIEQIKAIGESYRPQSNQGGPQGGPQDGRPGGPQGGPPNGPLGGPDSTAHAQREEQMQAMREEMFAVLTDAQKLLLAEIEAQLELGQYPDAAVEAKLTFLTEALGLDAGQQTEFTAIITEYGNRWIALRNTEDRQEAHEAMRTLFEELDAAVIAVLSEEQITAYETLKTECKPEGRGPGGPGSGGPGRGPHGPPGGTGN